MTDEGDHGGAYAVEWADLRVRPPAPSRSYPYINGFKSGQMVRLMGHLPPGKWKQSWAKAVENTVESGGKLKFGFKKERKNGVSTAMGKIFLKNLFQVFCAKIRCFHKNCAD